MRDASRVSLMFLKSNLQKDWQVIGSEEECLEYAQMMSETFGEEYPAATLAAEFQRELCCAHYLKGVEVKAIAKAADNPHEFIFETAHQDYPLIFVHLTWRAELDTDFPRIEKVEFERGLI